MWSFQSYCDTFIPKDGYRTVAQTEINTYIIMTIRRFVLNKSPNCRYTQLLKRSIFLSTFERLDSTMHSSMQKGNDSNHNQSNRSGRSEQPLSVQNTHAIHNLQSTIGNQCILRRLQTSSIICSNSDLSHTIQRDENTTEGSELYIDEMVRYFRRLAASFRTNFRMYRQRWGDDVSILRHIAQTLEEWDELYRTALGRIDETPPHAAVARTQLRDGYQAACEALHLVSNNSHRVNIVVIARPRRENDQFLQNARGYANMYYARPVIAEDSVVMIEDIANLEELLSRIDMIQPNRMIRRIDIFAHGSALTNTNRIIFGDEEYHPEQIQNAVDSRQFNSSSIQNISRFDTDSTIELHSCRLGHSEGEGLDHGEEFAHIFGQSIGGLHGQEIRSYREYYNPDVFQWFPGRDREAGPTGIVERFDWIPDNIRITNTSRDIYGPQSLPVRYHRTSEQARFQDVFRQMAIAYFNNLAIGSEELQRFLPNDEAAQRGDISDDRKLEIMRQFYDAGQGWRFAFMYPSHYQSGPINATFTNETSDWAQRVRTTRITTRRQATTPAPDFSMRDLLSTPHASSPLGVPVAPQWIAETPGRAASETIPFGPFPTMSGWRSAPGPQGQTDEPALNSTHPPEISETPETTGTISNTPDIQIQREQGRSTSRDNNLSAQARENAETLHILFDQYARAERSRQQRQRLYGEIDGLLLNAPQEQVVNMYQAYQQQYNNAFVSDLRRKFINNISMHDNYTPEQIQEERQRLFGIYTSRLFFAGIQEIVDVYPISAVAVPVNDTNERRWIAYWTDYFTTGAGNRRSYAAFALHLLPSWTNNIIDRLRTMRWIPERQSQSYAVTFAVLSPQAAAHTAGLQEGIRLFHNLLSALQSYIDSFAQNCADFQARVADLAPTLDAPRNWYNRLSGAPSFPTMDQQLVDQIDDARFLVEHNMIPASYTVITRQIAALLNIVRHWDALESPSSAELERAGIIIASP